jgi:hypothetical protein
VRGKGWYAHNGFFNEKNHRQSIFAVNGKVRMPERFAIDWIKIGENGKIVHDDMSKNDNWYGYGQDILAVEDGTVVFIKDGVPDNIPLSKDRAAPITFETLGGNCILLDIGQSHYAYYAHLQPGSIKARIGQRVRRGQALAKIGNSGNSDGPHLHFHIVNMNSPFGGEGLPYVFRSFDVQGILKSVPLIVNGEGWKKDANAATDIRRLEHPADDAIINFPDRPQQ